ncbi:MAG TPA: M1 family aminopeptidase [Patescibacteria group bacterium]|nr:M1 family aminopeptidase [Patescibacteria group bacterium]
MDDPRGRQWPQQPGHGCVLPVLAPAHPFLTHYQKDNGDGTCSPAGSTGAWWAATGARDGWEQWDVDLAAWAGKTVEISISYASDDVVQRKGLFVDDVAVSTGPGTTSFENDADPMDGWTTPGAPDGSQPNANDWIVGTVADTPPNAGQVAQGSFARQPEILDFLGQNFGRYPFSASGGLVDDIPGVGFALENQTRPVYAREFFTDSLSGDNVVVHELAHQWYGDSVAVKRWQDVWLNEGFATYAEWLWSEREGLGTAQENFDFWYGVFADDDPFWTVPPGDPTPTSLFDFAVYARGGMTLHQLRLAVGDPAFFKILQQWAKSRGGGNGTTKQFIRLAEKISGQDVDALFQTWLYDPVKPAIPAPLLRQAARSLDLRHAPVAAQSLYQRYGHGVKLTGAP